MFINSKFQIGDRVRLKEDVNVLKGTFTKGHEFNVKNIEENSGTIVLNDDHGRDLRFEPQRIPVNLFIEQITNGNDEDLESKISRILRDNGVKEPTNVHLARSIIEEINNDSSPNLENDLKGVGV